MKTNAYAKLNLALGVTGALPGGYHALDMVMQEITLCDVVTVERAEESRVFCPGVDEQTNTAGKAAKLFFERTGIPGGARISIQKNIPPQAGLGGGSSDAAAVLRALNELYGAGLSARQLEEVGVKIGADVPFFIRGGCARAHGVGEQLTPVKNKCGFGYLLVKPEGGVATAAAYRLYDRLPKTDVDTPEVVRALAAGDAAAYFAAAGNALFPAALELCPPVGNVASDLKEHGAAFAMMTGSGSCCFGVFEDGELLRGAEKELKGKYPFVRAAGNRK